VLVWQDQYVVVVRPKSKANPRQIQGKTPSFALKKGVDIMTILTDRSLEFAKEHISKYYDSDFFPKPIEFEALWHAWDEVKRELVSRNVGKLLVSLPRAMTIAKPKGGFRVVHQLEPLDAIAYTALACEIASFVEAARMPVEDHIACSYRLSIADGSYFSGGSGWADFTAKTEELAERFPVILVTDISDFYNQIYLHRVNNALESADVSLKPIADDIEDFLSRLNNKASQGVPVGPAASIVMSEAVLIDVDLFLKGLGVSHTRYVDDFRIFSNSKRELTSVLERLTLYLYENHRLTVSSEKTFVIDSSEFVDSHLHNQYVLEKDQLLENLDFSNPYANEYDEDEDEEGDEEEPTELQAMDEEAADQAQLIEAIERIIKYEHLDLTLARRVIRAARRNAQPVIARHLLENIEFFGPAVNDVALYLDEITDSALANELRPVVEALLSSTILDNQLVRFWIEWYVSKYPEYMQSQKIHRFVFGGPNVENQARAAISTKNVAWVRDHKSGIYNLGGWARRAVLHAARVLPSDERNHWLKMIIANSPVTIDRWVAKWVIDTA
jgi:hypothetical protein